MTEFDNAVAKARQLAQTQEGKQLVQKLQQSGGRDVQHALDAAAAGDLELAKKLLSNLINSPQGQQLMEALGGSHGK